MLQVQCCMSGLLHSNYPVDADLINNITYVMMMGPNKAIKHEIAKCFLKKVYIRTPQKKKVSNNLLFDRN